MNISLSQLSNRLRLTFKQLMLPRICDKVFGVPLKRADLDGLMQAAFVTKSWFKPKEEHAVIYKGDIEHLAADCEVLIRINSACYTGDIFHDRSCDCNEQFEISLRNIEQNQGPSLVIYHISHEGKAHGYLEKLKSYDGQMYPVNGDQRDFRTSIAILRSLGITRVRVMTNNPDKVKILKDYGIVVTGTVPIVVEDPNLRNFFDYKARVFGHRLPLMKSDPIDPAA